MFKKYGVTKEALEKNPLDKTIVKYGDKKEESEDKEPKNDESENSER